MRTLTFSHSPAALRTGSTGRSRGSRSRYSRVLHAIVVDGLGEVALLVEQADRDEVGALVAGSLAVVPGKHPEAAGIDRHALVEAVLGAEVRHQRLPVGGGRAAHVGLERLQRLAVARQVGLIARRSARACAG